MLAPRAAAPLSQQQQQQQQRRALNASSPFRSSTTAIDLAVVASQDLDRAATAASSSSSRVLSSPASRATAPFRNAAAAALSRGAETQEIGSSLVAPRAGGDGDDRSDAPLERALAAAPYLFPLLDGLRYGRFLFR